MIKEKMKEYWKEQKRLWTDPNEWRKLYSWTHWKIELKKELIKQKEEYTGIFTKTNLIKLLEKNIRQHAVTQNGKIAGLISFKNLDL